MSAFMATQKNPDANIRTMPRIYCLSLSGLFLECKPSGAGGVEKGGKFRTSYLRRTRQVVLDGFVGEDS